jgi:amino acid adenylation domain-containing protein
LVCIKLDRSDWAVIVILGILKAGGAYLPVDPDYPAERIAFMVEDSNSRLVIDKEELARIQKEVYEYTDFYLEDRKTAGSNLAYVIYTSGSTGQPKGVLISHASLFNYISYCLEKYLDNPSGKWKIPLFTSLSFDLTVTSIFTSLLTGGELFVYRQEANIKDVLVDVFQGLYRINFVKCTPAHIQLLSDIPDWRAGGTSVELIILGGEELTNSHVALLHSVNPAIKIYNEYGPTETTVGCVVYAVQRPEDGQNGLPAPARAIPIGKPISNMYIRITDASGDLAPIGVVGELLIGGAGVGKGYLNRDQLTADRFINDPYDPGSGGKLYKSGDLARWLPDGNIEYLGRRDDQVKIRGYRVELGEIENVLRQYDGLREVVVVAAKIRDDKKDKELMAYFIADTAVDITRIKDFLGQRLPDHMIPRLFSQISEFPLTINGKIDRKRLSESSATFLEPSGGKYIAPRNETEQALEKIWQELLDIKDTIGVRDDFFQLGGHSIRALKILSRVSREFGVVIGIQTMFEEPTIERLAMEILNARWLEGNSLAGSSQENERVKI